MRCVGSLCGIILVTKVLCQLDRQKQVAAGCCHLLCSFATAVWQPAAHAQTPTFLSVFAHAPRFVAVNVWLLLQRACWVVLP